MQLYRFSYTSINCISYFHDDCKPMILLKGNGLNEYQEELDQGIK